MALLEWKRQSVHLIWALGLAVISMFTSQVQFLIVCVFLLALTIALLLTKSKFALFLMDELERDHVKKLFPGKGSIAITVGPLLTALLFPAQLTAALLVLAFADSIATVVGASWGKKKVPWSPRKSWMGTGAFYVVTCAVLYFYTPLFFLAAIIPTVLEAVDYHNILFLDDNIIVPLATAAALVLL